STLCEGAAVWMTPNWAVPDRLAGSRKIPTRVTFGAISLSNSSHLPPRLYSNAINPVALPPGRARLSTKPALIGSTTTGNTTRIVRGGRQVHGDAPHALGLLRTRRERPRRRRAAEQRDELAPVVHSITSSARASSEGGISRPSALAVRRLITSSYLVGCCTGRS